MIDVKLGSKYASAYIHIQVSPIEIIWILNTLFWQKKNEMKQQ